VSRIILEPGNPFDFDGELEELAEELRSKTGKTTVVARRPEHGYGVSLHEVLHIWVVWNNLGGPAATALLLAVTGWAVRRWKQDQAKHPDRPRPRSVIIWGSNGRPLKSITVDKQDGDEPVVIDEPLNEIPKRQRPRSTA
jgi:hypothetical protein